MKAKRVTNSSRGGFPRKQKQLPVSFRKGGPPSKSDAALQKLATVVAQQHLAIQAMQKTPAGMALYRGRSDLGDLGDGIDQSIRSIRRLLNTEIKCFQAAGASAAPTTTGTIIDFLSGIAQGVTDVTRVGDSIKVLRVHLNWKFEMNATAAISQFVWFAVIRAHDEIMTAAQLNTLDANAYAFLGDCPWDYKDQYRILHQQRLVVDPEHQAMLGEVDLKLNDHAQYNAGGNTLNSGSIFLAIWSTTTVNNPDFSYVLQVEFVDN